MLINNDITRTALLALDMGGLCKVVDSFVCTMHYVISDDCLTGLYVKVDTCMYVYVYRIRVKVNSIEINYYGTEDIYIYIYI